MQNFKMLRQIFVRTILVAQVLSLAFFAFAQTIPCMPFDFVMRFKNANFSGNFLLNFTSNYFLVMQSFQQIGLSLFVCTLFIWAFVCPLMWLFVNKIYTSILNVEKKYLIKLNNNHGLNDLNLYILNNKLIC